MCWVLLLLKCAVCVQLLCELNVQKATNHIKKPNVNVVIEVPGFMSKIKLGANFGRSSLNNLTSYLQNKTFKQIKKSWS